MTKSEKREKKRNKLKYGMQESGRSTKYLSRLAAERAEKLRERDKASPIKPKKKRKNKKNRVNQKLALFNFMQFSNKYLKHPPYREEAFYVF